MRSFKLSTFVFGLVALVCLSFSQTAHAQSREIPFDILGSSFGWLPYIAIEESERNANFQLMELVRSIKAQSAVDVEVKIEIDKLHDVLIWEGSFVASWVLRGKLIVKQKVPVPVDPVPVDL